MQVFAELFEDHLVAATAKPTELSRSGKQASFIAATIDMFCGYCQEFSKMWPWAKTAERHSENLKAYHSRLTNVRSNKSCLCCLMRMPEKVLECGHAIRDVCVRIFGQRSGRQRYTYTLETCVLCGSASPSSCFTFIPPTAGVRMLSLDGGGVRGVIPLVFLMSLEKELTMLDIDTPLQDLFDLVCGTSLGDCPQ